MSIVIVYIPDSVPSSKSHVIEFPSWNELTGSVNSNPLLVIIILVVFVIGSPLVSSTYDTRLGSVTGVSVIPPARYPHLIQIGTGTADGEPSTDTVIEPIARPTAFDRSHGSCVEPITENSI